MLPLVVPHVYQLTNVTAVYGIRHTAYGNAEDFISMPTSYEEGL